MLTPADKIVISGMECLATIGVTVHERAAAQQLLIDLEFPADCRLAAGSDSISDTIDYDIVAQNVAAVCSSREFHLIETVAEQIAGSTLQKFRFSQVRVLVSQDFTGADTPRGVCFRRNRAPVGSL